MWGGQHVRPAGLMGERAPDNALEQFPINPETAPAFVGESEF